MHVAGIWFVLQSQAPYEHDAGPLAGRAEERAGRGSATCQCTSCGQVETRAACCCQRMSRLTSWCWWCAAAASASSSTCLAPSRMLVFVIEGERIQLSSILIGWRRPDLEELVVQLRVKLLDVSLLVDADWYRHLVDHRTVRTLQHSVHRRRAESQRQKAEEQDEGDTAGQESPHRDRVIPWGHRGKA